MSFVTLPKLIIFDKDGTLIDFAAMWGNWASSYIDRVASAVAPALTPSLYALFGVDPLSGRIDPHGALAIAPEAATQHQIAQLLLPYGYAYPAALQLTQSLWHAPDPATTAVPCADLDGLCRWLTAHGVRIAVATADNRQPTLQTLVALGIAPFISVVACADDPGLAPKPAPDKIHRICATLGIAPAQAWMIGDTPADMQMGRNAKVAACVAVTTGVSSHAELTPHADVVLSHVGLLPTLFAAGADVIF